MGTTRTILLLFSMLLLLSGALLAQAQEPQQGYSISWWTVDGGGGRASASGGYILDGTAGQPDPGPILGGGNYQLEGGFWGGRLSGTVKFHIYLPLVQRG